jgi:uncharacterized membrane protein YphA (DoxX/SURF4 family)
MKLASKIVASLLGLMFVVFGLNFWFHFIAVPSPAEGTPASAFTGSMYGSCYLTVVKVIEVLGGLALLVSCTRRLGIVLIGAVTFNIAVFHVAFFGWASLLDPVVAFAILATLFLVKSHNLLCCLSGCGCCNKEGSGCGSCCSKESSASCSVESSDKKSGGCGCG